MPAPTESECRARRALARSWYPSRVRQPGPAASENGQAFLSGGPLVSRSRRRRDGPSTRPAAEDSVARRQRRPMRETRAAQPGAATASGALSSRHVQERLHATLAHRGKVRQILEPEVAQEHFGRPKEDRKSNRLTSAQFADELTFEQPLDVPVTARTTDLLDLAPRDRLAVGDDRQGLQRAFGQRLAVLLLKEAAH